MCKKCRGGFSNKGSLLNHLCNKLKKESDEQKYQCPKCASVFSHKSFITHHKRVHGGLPQGYENVKKYVCEECSEEFLSKCGMQQHKRNKMCVQGLKEIYCDKCVPKEKFKTPTQFIRDLYTAKYQKLCQCPNSKWRYFAITFILNLDSITVQPLFGAGIPNRFWEM